MLAAMATPWFVHFLKHDYPASESPGILPQPAEKEHKTATQCACLHSYVEGKARGGAEKERKFKAARSATSSTMLRLWLKVFCSTHSKCSNPVSRLEKNKKKSV
jgi:hypothetical protein